MAASIRKCCDIGRRLIHCNRQAICWQNKRFVNTENNDPRRRQQIVDQDPYYYHDNTVPYFPEEDAKRSLEAEYPDVEFSREDYKYVERLLPAKTVPEVPEHAQYPTPSGWLPPTVEQQPQAYAVGRTRNHVIPIYYRKHFNGRQTVKLKNIYGDIWKLKEDIHTFYDANGWERCDIQVHEVGRFIRFRGNQYEKVGKFLLEKGF